MTTPPFVAVLVVGLGAALTAGGLWLLDRGPLAAPISPEDMTSGELALAWGVCAAPLGLVFLVGDRRTGTGWVTLGALALMALGLICVVLRRILYHRWR